MNFSRDMLEEKGEESLKKVEIINCRKREAKKESQKQYTEANAEVERNIKTNKKNGPGSRGGSSKWEQEPKKSGKY